MVLRFVTVEVLIARGIWLQILKLQNSRQNSVFILGTFSRTGQFCCCIDRTLYFRVAILKLIVY